VPRPYYDAQAAEARRISEPFLASRRTIGSVAGLHVMHMPVKVLMLG